MSAPPSSGAEPRAPGQARTRAQDLAVLAFLVGASWLVYRGLADRFVLDGDVVHLALGIERFDVRQHQPHPPGYLGYVLLLRLVHRATGLGLVATAQLVSQLFALSAIVLAWLGARVIARANLATAVWAAALTAASPIILYYGVDGQTHSAEAATSAALFVALARPGRPSRGRAVVIGLLLAAGGSLRPSFCLVSVVPTIACVGADLSILALIGAVAAAGTAAWLVPTALACGGWSEYRRLSAGLIGGLVRLNSVLSPARDARYVWRNLRDTFSWSALALAPALLALGLRRARRRALDPGERHAARLLALMAVPAIVFYAVVLCAEAGYLAGLVVPAALTAALVATPSSSGLGRWPLPVMVGALAAFFFVMPTRRFMLPTAAEALARELRAELLFDRIHAGLADDAAVLVLSDEPDSTALRQIPLLRPRTEILFFTAHRRYQMQPFDSLSLATRHGWRALPGGSLDIDGSLRTLETTTSYDWVVVDPRSSEGFWRAVQDQTRCAEEWRPEALQVPRLPSRCFAARSLRFGDAGYIFRFAPASAEAR